jgi:hypothetical protein
VKCDTVSPLRKNEIPCFREFLREFFAARLAISSFSAQNPQILLLAEGMEQGITGISLYQVRRKGLASHFFETRDAEQGISREFEP